MINPKESLMNFRKLVLSGLLLITVAAASSVSAQTKMTKEEWQKQITDYTGQRDNLKRTLAQLNKDIDSLKALLAPLDQKITAVNNETKFLTGSSDELRKAYAAQLSALENWVNELARLSNQDLFARKAEIDSVQAKLDDLKKSKLAAMQENHDRIQSLQQKIDGLRAALAKPEFVASLEKTYIVGTWKKDRDCLWNISKKKDIYDNPFMWPKIWQGNRDQIKDPDIIYKGQKLKIPTAGSLTDSEKKAEHKYWSKKRVGTK
jgi:predicted  nucleic acid-binding Zn-ribbon protein